MVIDSSFKGLEDIWRDLKNLRNSPKPIGIGGQTLFSGK